MGDISKFGTSILNGVKKSGQAVGNASKATGNAISDFINGKQKEGGEKKDYRFDQSKKQNDKVNTVFTSTEYGIEQESDTGDINNNTINNILTNVFSGNLFDAGISTITASNIHSSWYIAKRPITDENKYNFLYNLDISNNLNNSEGSTIENLNEADTNTSNKFHKYLDSMEDPTILGFSLMIDKDNSILFGEAEIQNLNEADLSGGNTIEKKGDVLWHYLEKYYNRVACELLENFRKDIMRVFVTPSVLDKGELYKGGLRNHYVKSISGLDKLDKMFVSYGGADKEKLECLELNLYEDVRLFTTNLKFMYNNFVYNYNQGIRVVPENLVKFNMFVKIAEKRNYTLHLEDDAVINRHTPTLIYQLHGCEFIFDDSILTNNVTMMDTGSGNDTYAGLKIKISYKKVTRIFDKPYGYAGSMKWVVDDTYYDLAKSNLNNSAVHANNIDIIESLQLNGFRPSLSNDMATSESLRSKISKFTNGGVLKPGENKTLAGKFVSTLGNNAIKASSQFVEEQAKKAKNAAQSEIASAIDRNPVLSSISNNAKNLLKSNIVVSTKNLKTMLPINSIIDQNGFGSIKNDISGILGSNQIQNTADLPAFVKQNDKLNAYQSKNGGGGGQLKTLNYDIDNNNGLDALDVSKEKYEEAKNKFETNLKTLEYDVDKDGDLDVLNVSKQKYEDAKNKFETNLKTLEYDVDKDGDLDVLNVSKEKYEDAKNKFIASKEDIVPDSNYTPSLTKKDLPILEYNGTKLESSVQKYADMVKKYLASKEDIVPDGTNTNILPNEDLSNGIKNNNVLPKEDLSNTTFKPEGYIINDIVPDAKNTNILPKENLNNGIITKNEFTINDIVPDSNYKPTLPKQDLSK
jgi:hypothetical protein